MRFYKIYSNAVRTTRHIIEIGSDGVRSLIDEAITDGFNSGSLEAPEDDSEYNVLYSRIFERAVDYFDKHGIFENGDYAVVRCDDDEEPTISNRYHESVSQL